MTRRCVVIANRGAGSFSEQTLERIRRLLLAGGVTAELLTGADFADLTGMAAETSRRADSPLIVAAGGDGTVNAVLKGVAGSSATCALLPLGTANVLAIELGMATVEQAVARIIAGESRLFTAGHLRTPEQSSLFFLMAGIGLDGFVVRRVSLRAKRLVGKGAYALAALRQAWSWEREELTVTTSAGSFTCHSLLVCNASRYGGPFVMAPEATIFSPTLELVAVRSSSRTTYLGLCYQMLKGRPPAPGADIVRLSAERVTIAGVKPAQVDGDDWGDSPLEIWAEKDYARIIV